jgi:hypothetical protein
MTGKYEVCTDEDVYGKTGTAVPHRRGSRQSERGVPQARWDSDEHEQTWATHRMSGTRGTLRVTAK